MPKSKKDKQNIEKSYLNQYILAGLLALSSVLAFLFWQNPLTVYDTAGHVSLVRFLADGWPKISGWNPSELLGWPAGTFYPPLFHYFAATLSLFLSVETAIKLLISVAMVALPISIYTYTRSVFTEKSWAIIGTLIVYFLLLLFPNFLGTGFRSLFQIGLLSNFFVLPFVFLFLGALHKGKSYLVLGLLLGILILTHVVAAIAAGIYLVTKIKIDFISKKKINFVYYGQLLGLSLLLTGFFWIPFILNLEFTSISRHVSSYLLPNVVLFVTSIAIGFWAWKKNETVLTNLAFFSSFITIFAVVDAFLIRMYETSFFLYQFHLYRFQPFAYLILAVAIIVLASKFIKLDKWGFIYQGIVFGLVGLITLVFLVKNPALLPNTELQITNPEKIEGAFLETFRRTEVDPFWYGPQTEINETNSANSWGYGLFTDSSPNGPFIASLIRSGRPEAYSESSIDLIETTVIDKIRAQNILNLFGINYLISLDRSEKNSVGYIQSTTKGLQRDRSYLNIERITNSEKFDVVRSSLKPVSGNWESEVKNWWDKSGEIKELPYLALEGEVGAVSAQDLQAGQVEIIEANESETSYSLNVKADSAVPVLAKISYFPYWQAKAADGEEIKIYRAAPNLMIFEAQGEVTLEYKEPIWLKLLYLISLITLVSTAYLLFRKKT